MAAYIIVNIEVTNPIEYAQYVAAAGATVAQFGGRYLVRGGKAEKLEGTIEPKRVVILEFDDANRAREWWSSSVYAGPKAIRHASAKTDMILVEGVT